MPQPPENARVFLVIILLLWLLSSPDTGPGLISVPSLTLARLARQRQAHGVMNSTKWGDFSPRLDGDPEDAEPRYLNMTGFREGDGLAWGDFARFRDRCLEWSRNANPSRDGKNLWDLGLASPTWQNVTGVVHGEWVREQGTSPRHPSSYNLSEITPGANWVGAHGEWGRNVTGQHGKIIMRFDDKEAHVEHEDEDGDSHPKSGGLVREISATVTLQDDASKGSAWDMRVYGVHWPRQGTILLTSTSEKFAGIFGLPHLSPGLNYFQSSQKLLNETLDEVLRRRERARFSDPTNPWMSNIEGQGGGWNPSPQCEYILYAQVHPLSSHQLKAQYSPESAREELGGLVSGIEDELRNPTGAPVGKIPELQTSTVMWSPDCSYFLESKGPPLFPAVDGQHLVGMKAEVLLHKARLWVLSFAAIMFGQIFLLKGQIRESSTPSTIGRVSFYTASIMLLADGLIFAASSAWSLSASTSLLPSLALTFSAFMSMTIGGAFLSEVYKIQEPERRNREREQQSATTSTTTTSAPTPAAAAAAAATARNPPSTTSELPRPVTAARPTTTPAIPPIIIPSDQDIDAEIAENTTAGASAVPTAQGTGTATAATPSTIAQQVRATTFSSISGRFILLGTCILFLSLAATSWPTPIRAAYVNLLAFTYLSLWVPQIWRNIQRNSRRAYSWRFTIGQSVLRILPFSYFYLKEDNIIFAEPDWKSFGLLAAWLWVQLWILAFQDVLGPRFGIPKGWAPEAWDYHPVLREDNLEAGGLPIGLISSSEPSSPILGKARRSGSLARSPDRSRKKDHYGDGISSNSGRSRKKDGSRGKTAAPTGPGLRTHSIDCAICREVLDVPVVPAGADPDAVGAGGGVAAVLARRSYMVTPCRHIFHSACLEGWLRFRLQCPICREELPPL